MRRLALAGANQVISAYQHGGMRVAATIVRPSVVDFLELATPGRGDRVDLEQLNIAANSRLVGLTIGAIEGENRKLRIVALKRGKEPITLIPDAQTVVAAGDYLVLIGDRASLQQLAGMLGD